MEQIIKIIFAITVFVITFIMVGKISGGTSVVMTSNSSGATITTTDFFGNKQVCTTEIIGSSSFTSCN